MQMDVNNVKGYSFSDAAGSSGSSEKSHKTSKKTQKQTRTEV